VTCEMTYVVETPVPLGAEAETEDHRCQVFTAPQMLEGPEQLRRSREFTERCPNQAQARVGGTCERGHQFTEDVCAGHISGKAPQWCAACTGDGLKADVTLVFLGWL
jgi:hypothetical protein